MAFIKDFEWKGYTPNYWFIVDRLINEENDTTCVTFGCYKNKNVRQLDVTSGGNKNKDNMLPSLYFKKQVVVPGTYHTKPELYVLCKQSDMREVVVPAVKDPITHEIITPSTTEMREFNFFVDAIDN